MNEQQLQAIISQLQAQIATQDEIIQKQSYQIQHLEDRVVLFEYKLEKSAKSEAWLAEAKKELVDFVHEQQPLRPDGSGSAQTLTAQVSNHTKVLNSLSRDLQKISRFEEQILLARTDFERLNQTITALEGHVERLQKGVGDKEQTLSQMETLRQTDSRRMAELQNELPTLQKRIEANVSSRIQVLERQLPQFGEYQMAMEKMREEARRQREQTEYQIAERERQMKNWFEMSQAHEQRLNKYEGMFERYAEQYQANKRILESLQDFQERLQRDQHQTQELYRLAEERQQVVFERWKADYEQRWRQQSSVWQPAVTEVERTLQHLQKQLTEVQKFNHAVEKHLEMVLQILEEDVHYRATMAQDWQRRFEEIATEDETKY